MQPTVSDFIFNSPTINPSPYLLPHSPSPQNTRTPLSLATLPRLGPSTSQNLLISSSSVRAPSNCCSSTLIKPSTIHSIGAGLYSFFSNYNQDCLATTSCQSQILNIDDESSVSIYSLSTVGVSYQISVQGQGIVDQSLNKNGFQETVTAWSRSCDWEGKNLDDDDDNFGQPGGIGIDLHL
jgi:hypothetical protein